MLSECVYTLCFNCSDHMCIHCVLTAMTIYSLCVELSEVLWSMVLQLGIGLAVQVGPAAGALVIFFLFAFWAGEQTSIVGPVYSQLPLTFCDSHTHTHAHAHAHTHSVDCWHPVGDGGTLCLPPCSASPLGGVSEQVL